MKLALSGVPAEQTERVVARILKSGRIFVYGAGRSGFVARSFTMRLKNLGLPIVRMSIDPTTPPGPDDCAVIISGTGETPSSVDYANLAHSGGAPVFAVTGRVGSALTRTGAETLLLASPASAPDPLIAPLGTVFEEAALVYLDSLVAVLMERLGQTEDDLRRRHGVTR
ncbi:MAG TPA: SIS domain-containing protein [Candidatus Thermoplasmatota archaeon]